MTLLEILAERLDKEAEWAITMAAHSRNQTRPLRAEYYHGQVVAYGRAADILRREAQDREGLDEEVSE